MSYQCHLPRQDDVAAFPVDDAGHFGGGGVGVHHERHGVGVDVGHWGFDIAGADGGDADAGFCHFYPQAFEIADGGGLGGGVGARSGKAAQAGDAGDSG